MLLSIPGLFAVSQLRPDWLAVAGCVAVLLAGGVIFDREGRRRAAADPHPLYVPARLPQDSPKVKLAAVSLTLAIVVVVIALTARPDQRPTPFPFFLAAGYIWLVLPQALAHRAIRRHDEKSH